MLWFSHTAEEISWPEVDKLLGRVIAEARGRLGPSPKRVLLLPPDITRMHSGAGKITERLYRALAAEAEVHVIPTLGQHIPHTPQQNRQMFGEIPEERIHAHDWRGGCVRVGEISSAEVKRLSGDAADWAIPIELNTMLMQEAWDWIINVGHVVPHEVLGFANGNKNYFIGLGGKESICTSHMMAACCGIENNLGTLVTPTRAAFDLAENELLRDLPDLYVQIVMRRAADGRLVHSGLHVGDDRETYLAAARQSQAENITLLDQPAERVVCVMQEDEFFSTWVANKAVYRTRMAIADGGELIILAPGLKRFGEQPEVEAIIRKYGYRGTANTMRNYESAAGTDLREMAHAAAHLNHGSSEGRFRIVYAPGHISRDDIETVGYQYADLAAMQNKYLPADGREGWQQTNNGEDYFFVPTPSIGLWATREKMEMRSSQR
ncbi:MAG: lactate racemase domain-containing protein [Pirellulales bacterium]|nr:lactate racemase domain-containing protein [Pirellulales bacterium]